MNVKRVGVRLFYALVYYVFFDFSGGCVLHMLFCTADALGNKKGGTEVPPRVVGLAGFEPAASSSRTKRATKLRYSPFCNSWKYYTIA